jgi:broad specificity phosphatase PhoE
VNGPVTDAGELTTVHFVRHGEVHNPAKILYGRLPGFRLSTLGREMAERIADSLESRDIVAVVSSPLTRAIETAGPLASRLALPILIDERLIEAGNEFEGQRVGVGDGALRSPRSWRYLRNPFRPSWGEPYHEIAERMLAAAADVRDRARGHEAVCVSHQLPIWIMRLAAERRRLWHDPRHRQCALASVTSLIYAGDDIVAVGYEEPAVDLLASASKVSGA